MQNDSDTEWKFARSKLWMSYFEEGATVPPPFNIIPSPKTLYHIIMWFKDKLCMCTKQQKRSKWQSIRVCIFRKYNCNLKIDRNGKCFWIILFRTGQHHLKWIKFSLTSTPPVLSCPIRWCLMFSKEAIANAVIPRSL